MRQIFTNGSMSIQVKVRLSSNIGWHRILKFEIIITTLYRNHVSHEPTTEIGIIIRLHCHLQSGTGLPYIS